MPTEAAFINQLPPYVTTGHIADAVGVQVWRIARLYESGAIPEPPRLSGRRLIPQSQLPIVIRCLKERGWLAPDFELGEP